MPIRYARTSPNISADWRVARPVEVTHADSPCEPTVLVVVVPRSEPPSGAAAVYVSALGDYRKGILIGRGGDA